MNKLTQLALWCALGATSLLGQATAGLGGLSGVVRDASGAPVPASKVLVANDAKGIRRTLETNQDGLFNAPNLVPSAGYTVSVNKDGFAAYEAKNIEILVGQNVNLNIALNVATSTTQVDVVSEAPIVEDTKTDVSQVVTTRQILDLPINGRRVDTFVLLTPAVVPDGTFGLLSFRGIAGGNAFLTDGNDTTNGYYNENAGRTRLTSQISQDAVQEFQVLTSAYSAEYGKASGGTVNTVTRSGSNDVHGTLYWFFRNRSLNARDIFAFVNPKEVRHQAGGSIGGSIIKNKLFYFFNGELQRRDFPLVASLRSPLFDNAGTGRFIGTCGQGTGATFATTAQCNAAIDYLRSRYFTVVDRSADTDLAFLKFDYRPTERHSFSLSGNYLYWNSPNGIQTQAVLANGNGVGNNANSSVRDRTLRAQWTYVPTSTAVNELRFGYFKDRQFDDNSPALLPSTGRAQITVAGQSNLGYATDYPRLNPSEQRYQFVDNYSQVFGKHSMKFGFDFSNTDDYVSILRNQFGSFTYGTFDAFALDFSGPTAGQKRYQTYTQRFGNPVVETTVKNYAMFAQDTFRFSPKLTLNLGVRYEYTSLPQPKILNPDYPETGRIPSTKDNVAPRFGLAYSLNGKTVVRAGYGIFFGRYAGGPINTFFVENGIYTRVINLRGTDINSFGPNFPTALGSGTGLPGSTTDITFAGKDYRNPYTQQGDIAIERELTRDLGLTVSYIWSRGLHLTTVRDINVGAPVCCLTYTINDASGNAVGNYTTQVYLRNNKVDSRYNRINVVDSGGNSYYNALAVQLRKRLSHGIEGSVAYTWSHAIDYNQGGGSDNTFFSSGPRSLNNGDYRNDKGSSTLDQRHRATFTAIWMPTFTQNNGWAARYLINNWQLSTLTTLASAQPVTQTVNVATAATYNGLALANPGTFTLNGFSGTTRVPFLPLNNVDIDQLYRVDARLTKILPITERIKTYLQFEAFNVFNHPFYTGVNTQAYSAAGTVLTPRTDVGVPNASQGFPDGTSARRAQASLRIVF